MPTPMIPQVCGLPPCAHAAPMASILVPRVWIWRRKNRHMNRFGVDADDKGHAEMGGGRSGSVDDVK
jgi:hypothetical protein